MPCKECNYNIAMDNSDMCENCQKEKEILCVECEETPAMVNSNICIFCATTEMSE